MKTIQRMALVLALIFCTSCLCAAADTSSVSYLGPEGTELGDIIVVYSHAHGTPRGQPG